MPIPDNRDSLVGPKQFHDLGWSNLADWRSQNFRTDCRAGSGSVHPLTISNSDPWPIMRDAWPVCLRDKQIHTNYTISSESSNIEH